MGGLVPLGYEVRDRQLVVDESEADTVRHIFQRYESGPFKEAKQSASGGVDEIYSGRRPYRRSDLVGEPEPAKEPHDLVVEMGRSRKMIDGSGLLDDGCVKPVIACEIGCDRTDGPVTDNNQVIEAIGHQKIPPAAGGLSSAYANAHAD